MNIYLKYGLVLILYIMLFVLVLLNKLNSHDFTSLIYISIGALGGYHAKNASQLLKKGDTNV